MLFEFHPNLFVPGVAGAVIGDMVAATDGAPEIMNQFPRELISW
jgi:Xaa-Pro aminopeptidase